MKISELRTQMAEAKSELAELWRVHTWTESELFRQAERICLLRNQIRKGEALLDKYRLKPRPMPNLEMRPAVQMEIE